MAHRSLKLTVWGKTADVEKRRAYFREYVAKNKARLFPKAAEWSRNNRLIRNRLQQLRRAGGNITKDQWQEIFHLYGGQCAICGARENIQMDHIIPVVKGGKTEVGNLQPLCKKCNQSKGSRMMEAIHHIVIKET